MHRDGMGWEESLAHILRVHVDDMRRVSLCYSIDVLWSFVIFPRTNMTSPISWYVVSIEALEQPVALELVFAARLFNAF